jgi:hypothetical protein
MLGTVLPWDVMDDVQRLTIDVPSDLHEAFKTKCFLSKPRVSMKQRLLEYMAKETGRPVPRLIDRRKLTRDEREKLDRRK